MFLWNIAVTSLVEVWIEMLPRIPCRSFSDVTSLVEVWIEIMLTESREHIDLSLPLWKCGLKSKKTIRTGPSICHFPCGSVD